MAVTLQLIMAALLFLAGLAMIIGGLTIILTREYQETMRVLSSQSTRLSAKSIADVGVQAAVEGTTQLIGAVTSLVQTAIGTGAFLCLLGTLICGGAFWLLTWIAR